MSSNSLLIRGGRVVNPRSTPSCYPADILVLGGKIAGIGQALETSPEFARHFSGEWGTVSEILDASGCYVIPGGIDPHTHFELVSNGEHVADNFRAGSRAAFFGGTTCIVEHPGFGPEGCELLHQVDAYQELAQGQSFVDYGLHLVFQPDARERGGGDPLDMLPLAVQLGYGSGKAYTTYAGKLDDEHLLRLMAAMRSSGCLLVVHCENDALTGWLRAHNPFPPHNPLAHPASRPPECEAEAVTRVLALAHAVDAPIYIAHLSTAGGLEAVRQARRRGQRVYVETCPQYLLLSDECYAREDGLAWVMAPPLRPREHCEALWEALANDEIDVVATDHCAYSLARKRELGSTSVFRCPGGIPGVETRLPLLFSHGVLGGRITLEQFVRLTSRNPAKIFGIPFKGRLVPGFDADIVVLDPQATGGLSWNELHQNIDYSPFGVLSEGSAAPLRGMPRHVVLRGGILLKDGRQVALEPQGEYIRRLP